jgi:hypothetical protein
MDTKLQTFQLNVGKKDVVQLSMMNDQDLQQYAVLAVAEPYARMSDGVVVTTPNYHTNWTKMIPTQTREGQWPIRSMLWIRRDIEAEQIPMPLADLTGAVLRLPGREVLVVSVYMEGKNDEMLLATMDMLHTQVTTFRNATGGRTDVIIMGDFSAASKAIAVCKEMVDNRPQPTPKSVYILEKPGEITTTKKSKVP